MEIKKFETQAKRYGFSILPFKNDKIENYAIYDSDLEWFGRFTIDEKSSQPLYAIDLGKSFSSIKKLIDAITEFNKTRICPAKCYGDYGIKNLGIEMAFHWYTSKLGYIEPIDTEKFGLNSKVLSNVWGEVVSSISISYKNDTNIVYVSTKDSIISCKFEDVDGCIKAINSLMITEALVNATKSIKIIDSKLGDVDMTQVEKTDYSLIVKNMKGIIKKELTNALKQLN